MKKVLLSIACAIAVTACFSGNSFAGNSVESAGKKVAHVDNDTAGADNKQKISDEATGQPEEQEVKRRSRRRR